MSILGYIICIALVVVIALSVAIILATCGEDTDFWDVEDDCDE